MIEWLEIKKDGTYPLSKNKMGRAESTFFIDGENPKGSFTVGIIGEEGGFVECPNGNSDKSFVVRHGKGVKLVLKVDGFTGEKSKIGFVMGKRKRIVVLLMGIIGPITGFVTDAIIDRITKRF